MNKKFCLIIFTLLCLNLTFTQAETAEDAPALDLGKLSATGGDAAVRTIGSVMDEDGYKFELQLNSRGASIEYARLTDYFTRATETDPMMILSPVMDDTGSQILSLASGYLSFDGFAGRFPLHKLNWRTGDITENNGVQSLTFSSELAVPDYGNVLRLTKTYKVAKDSQHLMVTLSFENLTDESFKINFELQSPTGMTREEVRTDMRSVVLAYSGNDGVIKSSRLDIGKIRPAIIKFYQSGDPSKLSDTIVERPKGTLIYEWGATCNKYFAAILRPEEESDQTNPVVERCEYYDSKTIKGLSPKQQPQTDGSEGIGYKLVYKSIELAPKGTGQNARQFDYMLYLGPLDKSLFEKDALYSKLGFVQSINFQACCGNIFRPISFFILAMMKAVYYVIPNYGVIIILLVLLVRTLLHPLTRKSQVSMMKMGKLGPKVQEIKEKYASNPTEMNKRVMELYKEQGANPMLGFLPMLIQMPIWISLYAAIQASIDLRGAKFLPFWITDLSAPDMLFNFPTIIIPLLGTHINSFNLLPILLAFAMVLQQKMMSSSQTALSPQMAQQQKMMLIMMPAMMLIFLYTAPSGLNLYIMASTFGGIMEQKVIKKHIKEQEEKEKYGKVPVTAKTGGKLKKKKPKPMFKS